MRIFCIRLCIPSHRNGQSASPNFADPRQDIGKLQNLSDGGTLLMTLKESARPAFGWHPSTVGKKGSFSLFPNIPQT